MTEKLFHSGLIVRSPTLACEDAVIYSVGWDAEVKQTQKSNKLLMQISGFHTPHIQFGSTYYNSAFLVRGLNPVNTIVITYNKTKGVINYRNQRFTNNELLVLTRDEEMDLVISDKNITFTIAIEESYFKKVFFEYYGMDFESRLKKYLLIDPKQERAFLEFLHFWIHYFLTNDTQNLLPQDYEKIEEDILLTLFGFITIDRQVSRSVNKILKEARNIIERSLELDLKLADLATHLGVSQRTLEYTFKKNLGMTPKSYQQILRLYAVRNELKHTASTTKKVSDTALKYAFFHMGHFASEYKKVFGESPLQTLKTALKKG